MNEHRLTVVALHAHPDDEVLLSGGTLALAAAEGHRVVVVTATRGEEGLAGPADGHGEQLAGLRMGELREAVGTLGCAEVRWLGYHDSGLDGSSPHPDAFVRADVEQAARRLARLLRDQAADVLITYDRNGGYGHPDHRQAHHVGMRAAQLAGTPRVLQATVPAGALRLATRILKRLRHPAGAVVVAGVEVFATRGEITHVVRVGRALPAKRRALAAHGSQRRSGDGFRVVDWLVRLPAPLASLVIGTEWFVDVSPCAQRPSSGTRRLSRRRRLFPLSGVSR